MRFDELNRGWRTFFFACLLGITGVSAFACKDGMNPQYTARFHIVDALTGLPVINATVSITGTNFECNARMSCGTAEAWHFDPQEGNEFAFQRNKTYTVTVAAEGYTTVNNHEMIVTSNEDDYEATIELPRVSTASFLPANSFRVTNSLGETVFAITPWGHALAAGSVNIDQASSQLSGTTAKELIVQDDSGENVARFDANGNVYLDAEVSENHSIGPKPLTSISTNSFSELVFEGALYGESAVVAMIDQAGVLHCQCLDEDLGISALNSDE